MGRKFGGVGGATRRRKSERCLHCSLGSAGYDAVNELVLFESVVCAQAIKGEVSSPRTFVKGRFIGSTSRCRAREGD